MAGTPTIGLILAGGRARRMGDIDKALVPLGGGNLIGRAVARLVPQCDRVIINANGEPDRFAVFGLPVVADTVEGYAGPLAGILAGLEWMADHAPSATHLLSVPVDGPFFPDDLGARLHKAAAVSNSQIACARSGARQHGVYGLWPAALGDDLRRALVADGIRKVDEFLARYDVAVAEWSDRPFDPFFNINTPDDLVVAERLLKTLVVGA